MTDTAETLREGPGTRIGPYKLLQQIGEGGFGVVFMADQEQPVVRRVALKIIKLGMDTRQVVARFEQERQALAMMDHPNIARVIDAGATETGRPYFVMELVKGDPIAEYCDKNKLSIADRLELFAQVCFAVQHAHSKGLIHRDIKPSNILVGTQDGRPSAKVIDFGIAKATSAKLTEKTLFTEHKQVIGTLQYMSPEQAQGSLDIDTRSDVYSLGVVLYELLTGSTPFDAKTMRDAMYSEVQRMILEDEPPKPSTRLRASADSLKSVAALRRVEPRRLGGLVHGELDWIVMKALEKDRARRYETASGLAMDVRRYLDGDAVVAAPPSRSYQLKKFVRRNRGTVTAAALVVGALVLGIVGTAWQAQRASGQRDLAIAAREAEAHQRELAESEKAAADVQRNRAVAAEAETKQRAAELESVAEFQGKMLAEVDPTTAGVRLTEDVRARLDAALAKSGMPDDERTAHLESFASLWSQLNPTDAALALIDSTILKPAVAAIDKQFVDQPAVAARLRSVLAERYRDLGLEEAALTLEQQTLAQRRSVLGGDHPDTITSIGNVGVYLNALGRWTDAEPYYREALEKSRRVRGNESPDTLTSVANMGNLLRDEGKTSEAEPFFREALDVRRRVLGEEHRDTLRSVNDWAMLLAAQGKLADAETAYRDAVAKRRRALGEEHPDTLSSMNDLAVLLKDEGKLDEAIALFRDLVAKRRKTLGEVHPATLNVIQNLGTVLGVSGHPEEAEALMREALASERRLLGPDHPKSITGLNNLAVFLVDHDKLTEAESMCREALERRRRTQGDDHPETLISYNVMGYVLRRQDKDAEAEPFVRKTLDIGRRVLGPAHPDTLIYAHNMAMLLMNQKQAAEAEALFQEVVSLGVPAIGAGHPTVLSATRQLAGMLLEQKRYAEAAALLSGAESAARTSYTGNSERYLGTIEEKLGRARARLGQFSAAESNLIEAHEIYVKTLGAAHSDSRNCTHLLADFYDLWDKAEPGKGHDAKAEEWKAALEAGGK